MKDTKDNVKVVNWIFFLHNWWEVQHTGVFISYKIYAMNIHKWDKEDM